MFNCTKIILFPFIFVSYECYNNISIHWIINKSNTGETTYVIYKIILQMLLSFSWQFVSMCTPYTDKEKQIKNNVTLDSFGIYQGIGYCK